MRNIRRGRNEFMYEDFKSRLISFSDDEYREFTMKGVPCDRPFLGVRIPKIRELVYQVSPDDFEEFLKAAPVSFEEVIARGFLISRLPYAEMLKVFDSQVLLLDNWCAVDTFCASLRKVVKGNEEDFLERKVEKLLASKDEFAVRAGLVFLLDFYVRFEYLFLIFDRIESLAFRDEYYIKMATAWLIAECFIKFPEETLVFMKKAKLSEFVLRKAISKICDSRRVDLSLKEEVKKLRKVGRKNG